MNIRSMRPRHARIGGFLFVLATMSCVGVGRVQPGVGEVETGSSTPPVASVRANPDTTVRPAQPQPELLPDEYDFALNLMDPASFRDGDQSFVIIDPSDRQKLKGIVRLTSKRIADPVGEYTGLHTVIAENLDLRKLPIIEGFMDARQAVGMSLVEYLTHGGFVLGLGEASPTLRQALMWEAGLVSEVDYHSEGLVPEHPIFHAYFDLSSKPMTATGEPIRTKGFFIGDRLVGVSGMPGDERGLVNAVVFALTQPGGIAKRYMGR